MQLKNLFTSIIQKKNSPTLKILVAGSSIMFIGSLIGNIFGYLFNLIMGRMLSVDDYGLLASLTSLLIILSIFGGAFTKIFAKFAAVYVAKEEYGKLKILILKGLKFTFLFSILFFILLFIASGIIGDFLHIDDNTLLIIIILASCLSLISSVMSGVLQGSMRFYAGSFLTILQSIVKLVFSIIFVYLGFSIFGATIGILISIFVGILLGFVFVMKYLRVGEDNITGDDFFNFKKEFGKYTYTFTLASVGIALLANTDIILVRHFMGEDLSGQYAALSLMGKAIFYLITPINFVFFPLIAQKKARNEKLINTVLLTSGIVFVGSITLSFIYFAFPNLVLGIFFPSIEYQGMGQYLGLFSLYILIFSMVNIITSFFLSIGKTKIYIFTLFAGVAQIILLSFFHGSFYQVIGVLFIVNLLLLLAYLVYYMMHGKN